MDQTSVLLSARGLQRTYGTAPTEVVALDRADLDVEAGRLLAIVGPSGSGKSTLLTIIGGLEAPTAGTVGFDGADLWDLSPTDLAVVRRRRIGYVFQEFNLLAGLTAAENVSAPLELDGVSSKQARLQAIDRLEQVGLADRSEAFPDDLSGGERQRVAIARGLIGDRALLLADEPTGALDSATGAQVMELLRLACTPQSAVVVVTHNREVAAGADRVISLRDGLIVADTETDTGSQTASGTAATPGADRSAAGAGR